MEPGQAYYITSPCPMATSEFWVGDRFRRLAYSLNLMGVVGLVDLKGILQISSKLGLAFSENTC